MHIDGVVRFAQLPNFLILLYLLKRFIEQLEELLKSKGMSLSTL